MTIRMQFSSISTKLLVEYLATCGYSLSAAAGLSDPGQWRGHGVLQHAVDIILGPPDLKFSGEVLTVPTAAGLPAPQVRAKVYDSGIVQLQGCKSYSQAVTAFSKLLDLFQAAASADGAAQVPAAVPGTAAVDMINVGFTMPPLSRVNCMGKAGLNDHFRSQPECLSVYSGASDGQPYIQGRLARGEPLWRVFLTGPVHIVGCNSLAGALRLSHWIQGVIDPQLLSLIEDTPVGTVLAGVGALALTQGLHQLQQRMNMCGTGVICVREWHLLMHIPA